MEYSFSSFVSLAFKRFSFDEVVQEITFFVQEHPDSHYKVILGTDSEGQGEIDFASAIVVHRIGSGGRAFVAKTRQPAYSLRQKIQTEATLSLALAHQLLPRLSSLLEGERPKAGFEIHLDVGERGATKDIIREVVGMVRGSGFIVRWKPDSYCASTVADRFTAPPRPKPTTAAA